MPYGLLMPFLFVGLGLHYVLVADVSTRSKVLVGCVVVSWWFARPWMPGLLSVLIQLVGSAYILVMYRISGASFR